MNKPITWGQFILLIGILFGIYYIWVAVIPSRGKPADIPTDPNAKKVEAEHKWVNGVQIY
jgi:hypothetical protein